MSLMSLETGEPCFKKVTKKKGKKPETDKGKKGSLERNERVT